MVDTCSTECVYVQIYTTEFIQVEVPTSAGHRRPLPTTTESPPSPPFLSFLISRSRLAARPNIFLRCVRTCPPLSLAPPFPSSPSLLPPLPPLSLSLSLPLLSSRLAARPALSLRCKRTPAMRAHACDARYFSLRPPCFCTFASSIQREWRHRHGIQIARNGFRKKSLGKQKNSNDFEGHNICDYLSTCYPDAQVRIVVPTWFGFNTLPSGHALSNIPKSMEIRSFQERDA
jgi:hypothetical protein